MGILEISMKFAVLIAAAIAIATPAMAQDWTSFRPGNQVHHNVTSPGNVNNNPYDPNNGSWGAYSATPDHPWGTCGSSYSPNCVNNPSTR
jgi:hypothetical protein